MGLKEKIQKLLSDITKTAEYYSKTRDKYETTKDSRLDYTCGCSYEAHYWKEQLERALEEV